MLSEKIYTLRRKSGLSQEQLAEKIGVSRQTISKWEGGLSTPELDKLQALSVFFQLSIDELTSEQDLDSSPVEAGQKDTPNKATDSKLGIGLCLTGAICLILYGILMVVQPSIIITLDGSAAITLNGTGMLMILFVALMAVGIILTFKKK